MLFSELSEEEVIALQNKLDSFYTIMSQEVEVLKEQSKKLQREKDIKTGKIITVVTIFNSSTVKLGFIYYKIIKYFQILIDISLTNECHTRAM